MTCLKFHSFLLSCSLHLNSFRKESRLIVLRSLFIALLNELMVARIDGINWHPKFEELGFFILRSLLITLVKVLLAAKVDRVSWHSEWLLLLLLSLYAPNILSSCLLVLMSGSMNFSKFSVKVKRQLLILIRLDFLLQCSVKGRAWFAIRTFFRRGQDRALATLGQIQTLYQHVCLEQLLFSFCRDLL